MRRHGHGSNRPGGFLAVFTAVVAVSVCVVLSTPRIAFAQVPDEGKIPYGETKQLSRSIPWTRRVEVTEAGAIQTLPTTWWGGGGVSRRGGSKVLSLRHLGNTTAILYIENVDNVLNGPTGFMSISLTELKVLRAGESRSISEQVTSVGYRTETGTLTNVPGQTLEESVTGMTGGPLEISVWK